MLVYAWLCLHICPGTVKWHTLSLLIGTNIGTGDINQQIPLEISRQDVQTLALTIFHDFSLTIFVGFLWYLDISLMSYYCFNYMHVNKMRNHSYERAITSNCQWDQMQGIYRAISWRFMNCLLWQEYLSAWKASRYNMFIDFHVSFLHILGGMKITLYSKFDWPIIISLIIPYILLGWKYPWYISLTDGPPVGTIFHRAKLKSIGIQ